MGYWDAQRNKCNGDGGNIYFVETYSGMHGCFLYDACVSSWWGPVGDLAEWSCRNHDTLIHILETTRDISLSLIPGYDCVQIALGRDRSALSYAGCALDLMPFVGEIDDFVTGGAKGLDEALGDMNSVRKAGEEGTAAERVIMCPSSFAADTRVLMADGSTKRIGDVKPGDLVMSSDPETGEQAAREVIATLPHTDDLLLFDTTAGRVVTTEDHRYWNATDGGWQESQNLAVGDRLLSADGHDVRVGGLDWSSVRTAPAYDLTIAGFHTFYVAVGDEHVLVHNCGPGAWGTVNESMSERAAKYQAQVTGRVGSAYIVGGVKFDGFAGGVLLDAKRPGYSGFIRNGAFQPWFDGADDLVAQAQRQLAAAGDTPVRWVVAEDDAAAAIRRLLSQRGVGGIEVVHLAPQ